MDRVMDERIQEALSAVVSEIRATEDPKELAATILALQALRGALGDTIDEAHDRLYRLLDQTETDLGTGIGVVRRTRDSRTTWNHEDLFRHVVSRHRKVDSETGEVTVDGAELADELWTLLAFSYWRKTPLRDRKIDPSEYSTTVYGRPRVRFLSKEGA